MATATMTTRAMLYSGHPILGALFTLRPWKVFIGASAVACLLLLIPARLLFLHSIPTAKGNLGFLYSYHWSVMYPLVIPLLLAMAVAVSERMKNCVNQLIAEGRITTRPDKVAPSYPEALSIFLQSWAKQLTIFALAVSVLVTLIDTHDLWIGYLTDRVPSSRNPEWDTAFNAQNWGAEYSTEEFIAYLQDRPLKHSNLLFDVIAYIFQGTAFFLAFFWIGKFTCYLIAFARLIGGDDSSYQFNPLTHDLDFRMGLKPMGRLFDNFLAITLVIVGFAFYKRLYLIDTGRGQPFGTYLTTTFLNIIRPPQGSTVPAPFDHFTELFKAQSWGLDGLDPSACITTLFMTIPVIVICFLPLWKIRVLVDRRRNEELGRLQQEYAEALSSRKLDRVQLVEYEKQCLEKANIWPNGNVRAKRYLTIILALAAGALAPPLLAVVLVINLSEGVAKYFKLIFQRRAA
jgi:hypothetical protein